MKMESKIPTKQVESPNNRAVSPVIGVILMVAITVILAAVIAAFVLDLGQGQSSTVDAGVSVDSSSQSVQLQLTNSGTADDGVHVTGDVEDEMDTDGTLTVEPDEDTLDSTGDSVTMEVGSEDDDDLGKNVVIQVTGVAESGDDTTVSSSDTHMVEVTIDNS